VFLVGHSIGGMIALMIAAGEPGFRLIGASVTGMGAVIRRGGAAGALASLPADATVDLPYDQRDQACSGRSSPARPTGSRRRTRRTRRFRCASWCRRRSGRTATCPAWRHG
jgi:pimeloyl-ACP methyl ester carboxylesterase